MTRQLLDTYDEIKIADLNIAAMNEVWVNAPPRLETLHYKTERANVKVVVDRYFPSSQLHHGCTTRLAGAKLAKRLTCDTCHVEVDRDENASLNIRDWSVISPGLVESTALFVLGPFATGDSSDDGMTHHLKRACKTGSNTGRARRGKNNSRASEHEVRDENFLKGASK